MLPRCSRVTDILDAHTLLEAIKYLALAAVDALAAIFTESYLSLSAVFCLYLLCWCMAKSGGYGTIPGAAPPPAPGKRESIWESLALRCASPAFLSFSPLTLDTLWGACPPSIRHCRHSKLREPSLHSEGCSGRLLLIACTPAPVAYCCGPSQEGLLEC